MAEQDKGLGLGALVIAALAALGIAGPSVRTPMVLSSASPTDKEISSTAFAHASQHYEHSAVDLLEDFFDEDPDQVAKRPWTRGQVKPVMLTASDYKILYLIATLPGPGTQRLRYQFDDYQNAIELAANAAGFTLDSFDLPWLGNPGAQSQDKDLMVTPASRTAESETAIKRDENGKKRVHDDPGVMLFRNDRRHRLLVVLVVGETPTGGINKVAFRNALDQVTWLSGWPVAPPKEGAPSNLRERATSNNRPVVRILGPTFSGSAASIMETLLAWRSTFTEGQPEVRIISLATALGRGLETDGLATLSITQIPVERSFPYITASLSSGIAHFGRLRNTTTARTVRVAILHEESAFGNAEPSANDADSDVHKKEPDVTLLPFPLHISDVRTVTEKLEAAQISRVPDVSHRDVPVAEEDSDEEERDVIPSFSKRSAAYDERILYNLLSTIHQERFTYVGIIATDVEDLVFLAHEIRLACPDTILFTTSSNIRYLNSDVNPDLRGMLVFSTYPLFAMSQNWTFPFDLTNQIQFQSNASEAEYNGMLAYLGEATDLEEDRAEARKEELAITKKMLDYDAPLHESEPDGLTSPVLWVSVVGRDAIWPLAFFKVDESELLKRKVSNDQMEKSRDANAMRTLHSSLIWLAIWTGLPLLFVGFAASTGWIRRRAAGMIVAALILALMAVIWTVWPSPSAVWTITLLRATTLWSGVSPLHPALFATIAATVLIFGRLRGIALADEYPLTDRFLGLEHCASFEGIEALVGGVAQLLRCPETQLPKVLLWAILFTTGCVMLIFHCWNGFGYSIDGIWFESLMLLVEIIASALLLTMLLRAIYVWRLFHELLRRLYWHPTRAYYAIARERRLPEDSDHHNPIKLFESRPSYSALEYCLECARRLVWLANKQATRKRLSDDSIVDRIICERIALSSAVDKAERELTKALNLEAKEGFRTDAARFQREASQQALAQLAKTVGDIYGPYWRLEARPSLIGENKLQFNDDGEALGTERKAGVIELGGIFVAARVVDFIQHVLPHLLNAAVFATVAAIALMLSVSEYPFPYRDSLIVISWVMLLIVATTIITIVVLMNRNRVISLLSGTTPGKFNFDSTFVWTVITFGVLPVFTILGAQFPHVFSALLSWIGGSGAGGHP